MAQTNAELKEALDKANEELAAMKSQPQQPDPALSLEVKQLREELAGKQSAIDGLQKDLNDALEIIQEQNTALTKEEVSTEGVVITVNKKKYRVAMPVFNVGGTEVTAAQLKEDKALAEMLVEKGSGILQLITKE